MFVVALFTIAKLSKQSISPITDEQIKKMWHTYTMEYYSAIKNKEMMLFTSKWMDLEIILSEASRVQKTKVTCFLSYVVDPR
jgi:hypothetical protein